MSFRDHLIAATLALAVMAVSLLTGRGPEVATRDIDVPVDIAQP